MVGRSLPVRETGELGSMRVLFNFILFQIGWFACVLSAAAGNPVLGVGVAAVIIAIHLVMMKQKQHEIILIVSATLTGLVWDSFLVWRNWIDYPSGMLVSNMAPYWIVVMWGLFATTLNVSLAWLKQKLALAALLGAVAGPLAYYAGYKLNALQLNDMSVALIALAIGWALFTPLLIRLTVYLQWQELKKSGETI
jgi:hypothetical protein